MRVSPHVQPGSTRLRHFQYEPGLNDRIKIKQSHQMNGNQSLVIIPSEIEAWISGVFYAEVAADKTVSLVYERGSRISARLEFISHALQSNLMALVRSVQDGARSTGQRSSCERISKCIGGPSTPLRQDMRRLFPSRS